MASSSGLTDDAPPFPMHDVSMLDENHEDHWIFEEQEEAFMFPEFNTRGDMGTYTAHAEYPPTMEVSYDAPRDSYLDPQYTATQLAPVLDILSAHKAPPSNKEEQTGVQTENVQVPQQPQQTAPLPPHGDDNNPTTLLDPFTLSSPDSLKLWHDGRIALSNPTYFYTMMRKFGSTNGVLKRGADGVKDEDVGERFPVRMREAILEVEQGVADLRMLLSECLRVEDDAALMALRDRVKVALVFE